MAKSRLKESVLELVPLIAELRAKGMEYRDIAAHITKNHKIAISHVHVWRIFNEALQVRADAAINEYRQSLLDNYMFELDRLEGEIVKSRGKKTKRTVRTIVVPNDLADDSGNLLAKKGQQVTQVEVQEWEEGINVAYVTAKLKIFGDIRAMLGVDEPVKKETFPGGGEGGGGGAASKTKISILKLPSNGREITNIPVDKHDEDE